MRGELIGVGEDGVEVTELHLKRARRPGAQPCTNGGRRGLWGPGGAVGDAAGM